MLSSIRLVVLLVLVTTPAVAVSLGPTSQSSTATLPHDDPAVADGGVTVLRGAESLFERVHAPADIRAARADGRLRDHDYLTRGDTLVLQFHAPKLTRSLADTDGQSLTDRFFRHRNQTRFDFSINSTSHSAEGQPARLWLNRTNTRVITDTTNGTVWVLVDTTATAVVSRLSRGSVRQNLDDFAFEVVVEIPLDTDERRILAEQSTFVGRWATTRSPTVRATFSYGPWTLPRSSTETFVVNATTSLFPGSNVTVRAVTPNGTVLAEQKVQTTDSTAPGISADASTLQTTLLLGSLSADTTFELRLRSQNDSLFDHPVVVGQPARLWNTSAELLDSGPHAGEVRVSTTLHLPDEGFLEVSRYGDSTVEQVPENDTVRVTVYVNRRIVREGSVLIRAIWDHDDDGEYDEDDRRFSTTADLRAIQEEDKIVFLQPVSNWTPPTTTATTTPTPSWTRSPTASPTTTTEPATTVRTETDQTTTGARGPGWLLALVGLLACSFLSALQSKRD